MATLRSFVIRHVWKNFFRHGYRKYEFPHDQGQNRGNRPESLDYLGLPNIPGMDDQIRISEGLKRLWSKQTMGV